jgi:hypothetical protein
LIHKSSGGFQVEGENATRILQLVTILITFAAQTALSLFCFRVEERKVRATQGIVLLNRKAGESL